MSDEAELKRQIDEAMAKFQTELSELQTKLDTEVEAIIAEAKQKKIEELTAKLNQTNA